MDEEKKQSTDNGVIDFSKLKQKVKGFFEENKPETVESKTHSLHEKQNSDDSLSLDLKIIKSNLKKHAAWLIPLVCILFAVIASVYLRTMPQRMPIADQWAEEKVTNYYQGLIKQQIDQQYSYLPEQNKQFIIKQEWQNFQNKNKDNLEVEKETIAKQYREEFRNEEGALYLLGIDPYYYYRQTEYIIKNGFPGTGHFEDGSLKDDYRLAPIGGASQWNFHNWFAAKWHAFANLFGDFPLMYTFFFVGVIFSALTVIPGFFIGKKLSKNNVGGFFTAFLLAVTSFFVTRTTGESSDTDVYTVFFPVLITWLLLEALDAKNLKWRLSWVSLAGLATGIFAFAWTGWWYIFFFLIAMLGFQIMYLIIVSWKNLKAVVTSPELKKSSFLLGLYVLVSSIFANIFISFVDFIGIFSKPLRVIYLKSLSGAYSPLGGAYSLWPNIRSTIAELNIYPFEKIISILGGKMFFFLAVVCIFILVLRKNELGKREPHLGFFIALWLGASFFATTKGVRFILQATPIFAIAVGVCLGILWHYVSQWVTKELKLNKNITKIIIFLLLSILLINPAKAGYEQAHDSVPRMNDPWYNTLTKIKEEAPHNIIITSWWDFGHWFRAIGDRPVTFDGGSQNPWDAYWVGKSLLSNDEKATVGIVRMLNCGQNSAFDEVEKIIQDTPKSVQLLNEIVILDKNTAAKKLQQEGLTDIEAAAVLQYTHCDNPPEDYYITSEDMVGKAGVWGHFGSWDFNRAVMYQKTRKLATKEAVELLTNEFGLSKEEAEKVHAEIKSTDADRWIAPWPRYPSEVSECEKTSENKLSCPGLLDDKKFIVNIDLKNYSAKFEVQQEVYPYSLVYTTPEGIVEKKFSGNTAELSIILIPFEDKYLILTADLPQARSMFTKLYFFNGHGLKCFSKFSEVQNFEGGRILTWKIDYNCQQKNSIFLAEEEQLST